jgi:hypothetical protein
MAPFSARALPLFSKILFSLALVAFAGYLIIFCAYASALFRFPYDYDQGEGFELNDSILFARGEWPYRDNEAFPFYASNYGPVFHLLVVPLFPIFGQTLAAGRGLSFLATLLIGAIVFRIVNRQMRDRRIAALSGLMVFASNFVYHIGPLFRQHMTMVLFELLAVATISGYDHPRRGRRNILLSMLLLLLAGYTKQLSATTAVAVLAFLFLRAPKKAIVAGLGLAAAAGLIFVGLDAATNGQWFVNSIIANANAYDYRQALDLYGQFFSLHFAVAGLAIGYLVYELYWDRLSAYSVWFALALANAALSGKWGAGESYFVTAIVAACITSGLAIGKLKQWISSDDFGRPAWRATEVAATGALLSLAIPLLYLAQAWGVRHLPTDGPLFGPLAGLIGVGRGASVYADYPYYDAVGYTQLGHLPSEEDVAAGDRIIRLMLSAETPVMTEEAAFVLEANRRAGRYAQPVVTNPTQLLNLWNNNALDPTELIAMLDRQAFGQIVLRAQFYPPPVLKAIGARYAPTDNIWMNGFQYRILGPRGDYDGAACDEATFYGLISRLNSNAPAGGFFRVVNRDTYPEGWRGEAGASELEYRVGDGRNSRGPYYRLWIAPLNWRGDPPSGGAGAARLHQDRCFQYFDMTLDNSNGPSARDAVINTLGLRG